MPQPKDKYWLNGYQNKTPICAVSPWVYPVWDSLGFLDLGGYFLPHVRDIFNYYLLKYFLMPLLFVLFWVAFSF